MEAFHCRVNTPLCNSNNYNTNFLASMQRMISVQPCNYARLLSVSCSSAAPPAKNNKRRTSRDYSAKTSITTSRTGISSMIYISLAYLKLEKNQEIRIGKCVDELTLSRVKRFFKPCRKTPEAKFGSITPQSWYATLSV